MPLTLRNKLVLMIVVVVISFSLPVLIFSSNVLTERLFAETQKKNLYLAKHLAQMSITPLLTEESIKVRLNIMVSDFKKTYGEDIKYVFILGPAGNVLAHTFKEGFPVDLKRANTLRSEEDFSFQPITSDKGRILDIAVTIADGKLGTARLGICLSTIESAVSGIVRLIIGIAVITLCLGTIVSIIFARRITKPIHNLVKGTMALERGERPVKIPITSEDEVGVLARSFNQMSDHLIRTDTKLRESEGKLRAIFDNVTDGILIADTEKKRFYIGNKTICQMLGYSHDEIMNLNVMDIHPEESLPHVIKQFEKQARGEFSLAKDIPLKRKDGTVFYSDINATRINISGKDYMLGVFRDVTERMLAREELLKSERRYRNITENSSFGISTYDESGQCIVANKALADIIGATPEQVLLENFYKIKSWQQSGMFGAAKEALESGEKKTKRVHVFTTFGKDAWLNCTFIPYHEKGKQFLMLIVEEITERINAEQARKLLTKELEQLVYITSHDLRSPLANVEGYQKEIIYSLEDLKKVLNETQIPDKTGEKIRTIIDKDIPESVKYINSSIYKMDSLLSGLLRLSRTGSTRLNKEKINMNDLIKEIISTFEYNFITSGARHEISGLPECVGDKEQVNQLFSNLIGNALKYLVPERQGIISISGLKKNGEVQYCVEDNGIGISADEQEKIFDLFHQVRSVSEGEGLGLSIIKKIVQRHDGKVWVESEEGKGSRFYVSLPSTA